MTKQTKGPDAGQQSKARGLFSQNIDNAAYSCFDSCFGDSETIADPLYGMIDISSFEKRLIACREMQRLREIRQLGVAHLVYPSAEHSRFTHSLGVCHQAKHLIDKINSNLLREPRYRDWREYGYYRGALATPSNLKIIERVERVVISAAALLHDLSHGPFSHDMEPPRGAAHFNQLPEHDRFSENPALFQYLFDTESSQIAEVIKEFNQTFWLGGMASPDNGGNWGDLIKDENARYLSEDGYIKIEKGSLISQGEVPSPYSRLPILGIMIFEIHLFEKEPSWLEIERDEKTKRIIGFANPTKPHQVVTDWKLNTKREATLVPESKSTGMVISPENEKKASLNWQPIKGWFRPYRKEIIGNTICSDLIDYIKRDGYNSGILSHVDLKFLDRMVVTRAVLGDGQAVDLSVDWQRIPEICEHVVFDIYDHKRGFIRQSVITEILACLHARYLLCERVYQHRVVEGGRAMIQEIARLLCEAKFLSGAAIHNQDKQQRAFRISGDAVFLAWVLALDEMIVSEESAKNAIRSAKQLAAMLRERRMYREAVIIDGLHGFETPGSMAGAEKNCEALAEILLPQTAEKRRTLATFIERSTVKLRDRWSECGRNPSDFPVTPLLIGIREFGRRYKVPLVLVAKPFPSREEGTAPVEIQPLFVCADPPHIKDQLEAMKAAYASLWRVYLFLHPGFHQFGKAELEIHKMLEYDFLEFLRKETKIPWRNSIKISQLLPSEAIDIRHFLEDKTRLRQEPEIKEVASKIMLIAWATWLSKDTAETAVIKLAQESEAILSLRILKDWSLFGAISDKQVLTIILQSFRDNLQELAVAARPRNPEKAAEKAFRILKEALHPSL